MSSLSLPRSAPGWRQLALRALSWWLSELAGLMPEGLRRLLAGRPDALVIRFGLHEACLTVSKRSSDKLVIIPLSTAPGASAAWIKQRFSGNAVRILLEEDAVFRCSVELPEAATANMAQILRHQLERLVPLPPETISFVWSIASRLPARRALEISLAIVKNTTLVQAADLARQIGLLPNVILVSQESGTAAVWRADAADGLSQRRRLLYRGLEAASVVMFIAAYGVYVLRLEARDDFLRKQLAPAQAQLQAVRQLSRQLTATQAALASIEGRLAAPTPLAVLDELTRRLPLDASLSKFDFKREHIGLIGTAAHATALLDALTPSPLFDDPRFEAPITTAPSGIGEHFELSLKIRQPGR